MEIKINSELRPCIVKWRKALFHRWEDKSSIIPPSALVGGHNGGIRHQTVGIIEYEDGVVTECYPHEIRFVDGKIKEFAFPVKYKTCIIYTKDIDSSKLEPFDYIESALIRSGFDMNKPFDNVRDLKNDSWIYKQLIDESVKDEGKDIDDEKKSL